MTITQVYHKPEIIVYLFTQFIYRLFIAIFSLSHNIKNTVPAAIALSAKTVFLVRLQGFEPWTP